MVYIRQQFAGDELQSVTIQSLGLAGTNARLQLRLQQEVTQQCKDKLLAIDVDKNVWNEENEGRKELIRQPESNCKEDGHIQEKGAIMPHIAKSRKLRVTLYVLVENVVQSVSEDNGVSIGVPPIEPTPALSTVFIAEEKSPTSEPSVRISTQVFAEALATLMKSNFDAASRPVVITATKYLDNLIRKPDEIKYRVINIGNKIFREQVASVKNGILVINAMGFKSDPPRYLQDSALVSPNKLFFAIEHISDPIDTSGSHSQGPNTIDMSVLLSLRRVLNEVMDELNVSVEDRPVEPVPPSQRPPVSPSARPPVIDFDPFKPFIIRTSNQVVICFEAQSSYRHGLFINTKSNHYVYMFIASNCCCWW